MRSDGRGWRVCANGNRVRVERSLLAIAAIYLPHLLATILWYPVAGLVLARVPEPPGWLLIGAFGAPILALVLWAPALAAERRRIVLEQHDGQLVIGRARLSFESQLGLLVLPDRSLIRRTTHAVLVASSSDDIGPNAVLIATTASAASAHELAGRLATELGLELLTSGPPALARARVRTRSRE